MDIRVFETYDDMSEAAAKIVTAQITAQPNSVLGLAAGSTPIGLYKRLVQAAENGEIDCRHIKTFNLDEYVGLSADDPQSYHHVMQKMLFDGLKLRPDQVRIPDGMADDINLECTRFSAAIEAAGGIDLMIMGIGPNAHIGFNEPGDCFVPETHVVDLSDATRTANSRFFVSMADTPHWAISMGIRDILFARRILLMASGAGKTGALYKALKGDITPQAPASVLRFHKQVTVLVDRAAAARLEEDD